MSASSSVPDPGAVPTEPTGLRRVMSPGTNAADRLLGDLRLECEVGWAIARQSIAVGQFTDVAGTCKSGQLEFYANTHRRIADARVVAGSIARPVMLSPDRYSYRLPVADRTLPNSARVRFRFD